MGLRHSPASRGRRRSRHSSVEASRMVDSRHETHGLDDRLPGISLASKHAATFSRQTAEPAPSLAGFLHPSACTHPRSSSPIEERVERLSPRACRLSPAASACRLSPAASRLRPLPAASRLRASRLPPLACSLSPAASALRPLTRGLCPPASRLPPLACGLWPLACRLSPAASRPRPLASGLSPLAYYLPTVDYGFLR